MDVGAEWCHWCKELDKEIAKPDVQETLAAWTRVRLDADRDGDAVRRLSVGPIPALRLLTPDGRVVASQDGYLPGQELSAWLNEHFKQASAQAADAVGDAPADPAAADALVAKLSDPDAVVREAVTRRLLPRPDLAAAKVVDAFAGGKLAVRLAALELLQEWKAPIEKMDPWDPPTITAERIASLKAWAADAAKVAAATAPVASPETRPSTGPAPAAASSLGPDRLADARRDVAALLAATAEPEVLAARERLARFGPALLPEVYAALKTANTDRDRERLTALRYRLVASDALALSWPGGLERLASAEGAVRHAVLDELGSRATPADAPLLSELFSDPDAACPRAKPPAAAGGRRRRQQRRHRRARPPAPRPRAQRPRRRAEAVGRDSDARHGQGGGEVRRRREGPGPAGPRRARAARGQDQGGRGLPALVARPRKLAGAGGGGRSPGQGRGAKHLRRHGAGACGGRLRGHDPPARRPRRLRGRPRRPRPRDAQIAAALEPMYKAAEKRPELAGEVVRAMARDTNDPAALRDLRKFCANSDATVRAAAVAALCGSQPEGAREEIQSALKDAAPNVRLAAAQGLIAALEKMRPDPDREVGGVFSFGKKHKPDMAAWLDDFRSGRVRPGWLGATDEPLQKMLDTGSADEKLAAAVPLVAFGRDEKALPALRDAVKGPIGHRQRAIEALPWLPWDKRLELFQALVSTAAHAELPRIAEAMVSLPDPRAAGPLWDLPGNPAADATLAASVEQSLIQLYTGNRYSFPSGQPADKLKPLLEAANEKAAHGTEMQRLAALALLLSTSPDDAAAAAEKIVGDKSQPAAVRRDATQVLLLSRRKSENTKTAVALLKGGHDADWEMKKVAVRYLALGSSGIRQLRDAIYLNYTSNDTDELALFGGSGADRTRDDQAAGGPDGRDDQADGVRQRPGAGRVRRVPPHPSRRPLRTRRSGRLLVRGREPPQRVATARLPRGRGGQRRRAGAGAGGGLQEHGRQRPGEVLRPRLLLDDPRHEGPERAEAEEEDPGRGGDG